MEFITVEQFREQSKEVQEVFLKWWKPSIGDIFIFNTDGYDNSDSNIGVLASLKQINITRDSKGEYRIPLFTEGQLRKFIEEKTEGILVASCNVIGNRLINIVKKDEILGGVKTIRRTHFGEGIDLLEAYWRLACRIAQEEVDG